MEPADAGIENLIQLILIWVLLAPPIIKILGKTGLSRWWALLVILGPLGLFILVPVIGFRDWKDGVEETA